jgi:hypothetical protein
MIARLYRSEDAAGLDRILGNNRMGDVRLDRDRIVVAGPVGSPFACLVWRPYAFLHEFHCGSGLARHVVASALCSYALADAVARQHSVLDALFLVDPSNSHMLKFVRGEKAAEQDGVVFTLPLRPQISL